MARYRARGKINDLPRHARVASLTKGVSVQTTLCNTVLDNPSHKTEESLAAEILEFLESDTLW